MPADSADLLLRPWLALRLPGGGADQWCVCTSLRGVAADPAWRSLQAAVAVVGRRRRAREGWPRSSAVPPSTASRRSAGPTRGRATRFSRCGRRPSPCRRRTVSFSLAAFRQASRRPRPREPDNVLLAAAACELHPNAVLKGSRPRCEGALEAGDGGGDEARGRRGAERGRGRRGLLGRRPARGGGRDAADRSSRLEEPGKVGRAAPTAATRRAARAR